MRELWKTRKAMLELKEQIVYGQKLSEGDEVKVRLDDGTRMRFDADKITDEADNTVSVMLYDQKVCGTLVEGNQEEKKEKIVEFLPQTTVCVLPDVVKDIESSEKRVQIFFYKEPKEIREDKYVGDDWDKVWRTELATILGFVEKTTLKGRKEKRFPK